MSDDTSSEYTICDGCKLAVHWTETKNWIIVLSKCYHPTCFVEHRRPKQSTTDQHISDKQYHGENDY